MGVLGGNMRVIEVVYEDGVFKPLEKVSVKEGEKLRIKIERFDVSRYYGVFGKASVEELKRIEEEAQI